VAACAGFYELQHEKGIGGDEREKAKRKSCVVGNRKLSCCISFAYESLWSLAMPFPEAPAGRRAGGEHLWGGLSDSLSPFLT